MESEAVKDKAVNAMDFLLTKNELLNTRFVESGQARVSIMLLRREIIGFSTISVKTMLSRI